MSLCRARRADPWWGSAAGFCVSGYGDFFSENRPLISHCFQTGFRRCSVLASRICPLFFSLYLRLAESGQARTRPEGLAVPPQSSRKFGLDFMPPVVHRFRDVPLHIVGQLFGVLPGAVDRHVCRPRPRRMAALVRSCALAASWPKACAALGVRLRRTAGWQLRSCASCS